MRLAETCVVLCAGKGNRLMPPLQKVLTPVAGRPILSYVLDFWRHRVDKFVIVVGYKGKDVKRYVKENEREIECEFVEQGKQRGIADAILRARHKINRDFIVALGDCINEGYFVDPPDYMDCGVGVWKRDNVDEDVIRSGYAVDVIDGLVCKVREKPQDIGNSMCGMGTYYFKRSVFAHISQTPPSPLRNEVEITDVIQKMIDAECGVKPLWFMGDYINVTYVTDLEKAERVLKLGAASA